MAAYAAPGTLRWLACAFRSARRLRAPLWSVLTAGWARAFPWPTNTPLKDRTGLVVYQGPGQLRAFVAAHHAYETYTAGEPPRSYATWGFMQRVLDGLVLHPADDALLLGILAELFP